MTDELTIPIALPARIAKHQDSRSDLAYTLVDANGVTVIGATTWQLADWLRELINAQTHWQIAMADSLPGAWYDYTNQAWVKDGVYVTCGHSGAVKVGLRTLPCDCYGKKHAGKTPDKSIIEQYANAQAQSEDKLVEHLHGHVLESPALEHPPLRSLSEVQAERELDCEHLTSTPDGERCSECGKQLTGLDKAVITSQTYQNIRGNADPVQT